jgi:hypothetical protein
MYVSSSAPIPQNSMTPMSSAMRARYNGRKNRVFQSVLWAASRYACTSPVDSNSFQPFGLNLQYEVQRAQKLINAAGNQLSSAQITQASVSTSGSGHDAPKVIPLNPVDTNPEPRPDMKRLGPWDAPTWGDSSTVPLAPICTPGKTLMQAFQDHPWWAIGAFAAAGLAIGAFGVGASRRRAA